MAKPMRVELDAKGGGEFVIRLPDEFTGKIQLNCSKGTIVDFQPTELRRPAKNVDVELRG